jgi:hypothetical protein
MLGDGVYAPSVDITPDALKVSMDTQIALGNLAAQPDYKAVCCQQIHRTGAGDEIVSDGRSGAFSGSMRPFLDLFVWGLPA